MRRNIQAVLDTIEEKPPPVRIATYSAPAGMAFLLLAAFLASSTAVCVQECIRVGDDLEDRLLQCMDQCEVNGGHSKSGGTPCESQCHTKVRFTRRQVRHRQAECEQGCTSYPHLTRFSAFIGVTALLLVSPLLGSYVDACACECCKGLGCSPRQAVYNISWVFYGLSCLWVLPSIFEEKGQIGGKVLFGLAQCVSMAAMACSRSFAEAAQSKEGYMSHVGEPTRVAGAPGSAHPMGVMVGSPVNGPSNQELQTQIQQLQQQVRDLVRLQTMQVSAAQAPAAPAPASNPPAQLL